MQGQRSFFDSYDVDKGDVGDGTAPYNAAQFPIEFLPAVEALFRVDMQLVSEGRLHAEVPCPYRVGHDLYIIPARTTQSNPFAPAQQTQQRLFEDDGFPLPLALACDCPKAHEVVRELGRKLPPCSRNRCPVRFVLAAE